MIYLFLFFNISMKSIAAIAALPHLNRFSIILNTL